jgi:hypothetical protein
VICIVRPHGAESSSEVFVLKGAGGDFVDHLASTHGAAQSGPSAATQGVPAAVHLPAAATQRVASLPQMPAGLPATR